MHMISTRSRGIAATLAVSIACAWASSATAQTISPIMYFDGVSGHGEMIAIPAPSAADANNVELYGASSTGSGAPGGLLYRVSADRSTPAETIYQFGRLDEWTGAVPTAGLLLASDGRLYGGTAATSYDLLTNSTLGVSTLFRVDTDGQNYTKLFDFDERTRVNFADGSTFQYFQNVDGTAPVAPLIEVSLNSVDYLFGTTSAGGPHGTGTVFRVRTDGTDFQVLAAFDAAEVNSDNTAFLVKLDAPSIYSNGTKVNSNGLAPDQRLLYVVDSGVGYVYGTTATGGANGDGVVFRVPVNGGPIEVVHTFDAVVPADTTTDSSGVVTVNAPAYNADGAYPHSGLVLASDTNGTPYLYGTTLLYGPAKAGSIASSGGTVYRISMDGTNTYSVVHVFETDQATATDTPVNATGAGPAGQVIVGTGNVLIGTTSSGGSPASGSVTTTPAGNVYSIALDDINNPTFTEICRFTGEDAATNGSSPITGVTQAPDGSLYGIASGIYGNGLIYKCGSAAPGDGPLGVRPPYKSGGAFTEWGILMLFGLLGARGLVRRYGRRA